MKPLLQLGRKNLRSRADEEARPDVAEAARERRRDHEGGAVKPGNDAPIARQVAVARVSGSPVGPVAGASADIRPAGISGARSGGAQELTGLQQQDSRELPTLHNPVRNAPCCRVGARESERQLVNKGGEPSMTPGG